MLSNCIIIASNFVIHPQISVFVGLKSRVFPSYNIILIANKIFYVTVLLLMYFCDQFMAREIHHSRCFSSACPQLTWHSVTKTRF